MELTMEEQELAVPVTRQDRQALGNALWKHHPAMYRAAFSKLSNAEDAEDAVQDALLLAYRNIAQFKGESHISTWLVAIAINSARMQLRRRLRHRIVSLSPRHPTMGVHSLFTILRTVAQVRKSCTAKQRCARSSVNMLPSCLHLCAVRSSCGHSAAFLF